MDVGALYDAAECAGLLTIVRTSGADAVDIAVEFREPDENVLGGLAVSRDYRIRYPTARLSLAAGDTLTIGTDSYRVREVRRIGDGAETTASLSRL